MTTYGLADATLSNLALPLLIRHLKIDPTIMPYFAVNTMALQSEPPHSLPEKSQDEARTKAIQIKNRRLRYLVLHGDTYLSNPDLEFAGR